MIRRCALFLTFVVAACSSEPAARYLIDAPATDPVRVSVATIELRDVSLPGHASGSELLIQTETGGLVPLGAAIWADDPARAVTLQLAEAMDSGSSATVAAEPWPLFDRAQARVEVRISRMLAGTDGVFRLAGQVAISGDAVRERVERFDITTPLTETSAAAVSDAAGRSLTALSSQILGYLRR